MSVKIINKPRFNPDEYEYIQQGNHHDQSLMRCLIMALKGNDRRKHELDQAHNTIIQL